jgi:hypothetical protein
MINSTQTIDYSVSSFLELMYLVATDSTDGVRRRFFSRMKNSGRLRKPYKIARQLAREGDRHSRTPDESREVWKP